MIKIWRKTSVIILVSLTAVGIIATGLLMRYAGSGNVTGLSSSASLTTREDIQSELAGYQDQLADLKKQETSASADALVSLKSQEQQLQGQIDQDQYKLDHQVYGTTAGFRATAVQQLFTYKEQAASYADIPAALLTGPEAAQKRQAQNYADRLASVVENNDFKAYIAVENDIVNNDDTYTADEKKMYVSLNNLRDKLGLTGQGSLATDDSEMIFAQIQSGEEALLTNIDTSSGKARAMTDDEREKTRNNIAVYSWELSHGTYRSLDSAGESAVREMISVATLFAVLLMMILAGSSVSQEISTGSIKSLIIAPARRWKIFTAKFLSLLTMCLGMVLVIYLFTILTHGILFGFTTGLPYIYAVGGVAHTIPYYVYLLCYLLVAFLEVFIFLLLALMLSTITRNTAASVGISIAVYFGGSTIGSILMLLTNGPWLKFIPFNNFDVTARAFPYDSLMQSVSSATSGLTSNLTSVPLSFSLIYSLVVAALLFYMALDSFCRRDLR